MSYNNKQQTKNLDESYEEYTEKELKYLDKFQNDLMDDEELYDIITKFKFDDEKIAHEIGRLRGLLEAKGDDYSWKKVEQGKAKKIEEPQKHENKQNIQRKFDNYNKQKYNKDNNYNNYYQKNYNKGYGNDYVSGQDNQSPKRGRGGFKGNYRGGNNNYRGGNKGFRGRGGFRGGKKEHYREQLVDYNEQHYKETPVTHGNEEERRDDEVDVEESPKHHHHETATSHTHDHKHHHDTVADEEHDHHHYDGKHDHKTHSHSHHKDAKHSHSPKKDVNKFEEKIFETLETTNTKEHARIFSDNTNDSDIKALINDSEAIHENVSASTKKEQSPKKEQAFRQPEHVFTKDISFHIHQNPTQTPPQTHYMPQPQSHTIQSSHINIPSSSTTTSTKPKPTVVPTSTSTSTTTTTNVRPEDVPMTQHPYMVPFPMYYYPPNFETGNTSTGTPQYYPMMPHPMMYYMPPYGYGYNPHEEHSPEKMKNYGYGKPRPEETTSAYPQMNPMMYYHNQPNYSTGGMPMTQGTQPYPYTYGFPNPMDPHHHFETKKK